MDVKVGDVVTRMLCGTIPMQLRVTAVTEKLIICAVPGFETGPHADAWTFDRETGAEIDDYLDWGPPPKRTGSYLVKLS